MSFVCPGDLLGAAGSATAGVGVYVGAGGALFASVSGVVTHAASSASAPPQLSVCRPYAPRAPLPLVGSTVLARVARVTSAAASVELLAVDGAPASAGGFRGVVRRENVRPGEVDRVIMGECFKPGDIIRAEVVAAGGRVGAVLSTTGASLGVVAAHSDCGAVMVPVSSEEFEVPGAGIRERRKVARPEMTAGSR